MLLYFSPSGDFRQPLFARKLGGFSLFSFLLVLVCLCVGRVSVHACACLCAVQRTTRAVVPQVRTLFFFNTLSLASIGRLASENLLHFLTPGLYQTRPINKKNEFNDHIQFLTLARQALHWLRSLSSPLWYFLLKRRICRVKCATSQHTTQWVSVPAFVYMSIVEGNRLFLSPWQSETYGWLNEWIFCLFTLPRLECFHPLSVVFL